MSVPVGYGRVRAYYACIRCWCGLFGRFSSTIILFKFLSPFL